MDSDFKNAYSFIKDLSLNGSVSVNSQKKIEEKFLLKSRGSEEAIYSCGFIPERYKRNNLGVKNQKSLFNSSILIAGCGATGQSISSALARLGFGHIILFDPDIFEESNLNRQVFAFEENLGKKKVVETKKYLDKINKALIIEALDKKIETSLFKEKLKKADLVIDALDNFESRLFLENECKQNNKILIHSGISGWCCQVKVIKPGEDFLKESLSNKTSKKILERNLAFSVYTLSGIISSICVKIITGQFNNNDKSFYFFDLENNDFIAQ